MAKPEIPESARVLAVREMLSLMTKDLRLLGYVEAEKSATLDNFSEYASDYKTHSSLSSVTERSTQNQILEKISERANRQTEWVRQINNDTGCSNARSRVTVTGYIINVCVSPLVE